MRVYTSGQSCWIPNQSEKFVGSNPTARASIKKLSKTTFMVRFI